MEVIHAGSNGSSPERLFAPATEQLYSQYLDPAFPLEDRLQAAFNELGVSTAEQQRIRAMLAPLKEKHFPTYEHSIRVGLIASRIAAFFQLNERALLYDGLLHDIGKALSPLEVLQKTRDWTPADQAIIERHVNDGIGLLAGKFDFTADSIKFHHYFQDRPYPKEIPPDLHDYSAMTRLLLEEHGRLVAIADTFDSLHRINEKHGEKKPLSGEEIKERMLAAHPDRADAIEALFRGGVLTTFIAGQAHAESKALDESDGLHEESFHFQSHERTPDSTRRHIQIACALEPLSEKAGATTRGRDISRHLKLEYFVVAAINSADAFAEMAREIERHELCPENLYRFGVQAQLESKMNRRGGRVNHGIIELLVPIVAAQHLHDPDYLHEPEAVLRLAGDYLERTSRNDVDSLTKLKRLAHALSKYEGRTVPEHQVASTVREYYVCELEMNSGSETSLAHNAEFLTGFPTVQLVCDTLANCPYPHFNQRIEEAYHRARFRHAPEVGTGFIADCVAVGTYLHLSQNPRERLVG